MKEVSDSLTTLGMEWFSTAVLPATVLMPVVLPVQHIYEPLCAIGDALTHDETWKIS